MVNKIIIFLHEPHKAKKKDKVLLDLNLTEIIAPYITN